MNTVRAGVIERNRLFRTGLKALLKSADFEIVSEMETVSDLETLQPNAAELWLIDVAGPVSIAESTIRRVATHSPDSYIVALTDEVSAKLLCIAYGAGARGLLEKDVSPDALVESLRLVMLGEKVFPTVLASMLASLGGQLTGPLGAIASRPNPDLSNGEIRVIRRLAAGESNKLIARHLEITESTVKVHLKSILRKLGVANRTQAAIWAINNGYALPETQGDDKIEA